MTDGAALIEPAEDGKLALTGAQAKEFLNGQVSNDTTLLTPGHGCYAAMLSNKGKMLADLRVIDTGGELLLLTERATLQTVFDTLRRAIVGWDAELHKRTLQLHRFVLIGPRATEVAGAPELATEHDNALGEVPGARVTYIATDTGVEVLCEAEQAAAVRQALLERGATPADEAAAEVLRVERGRPRYGAELDDTVIPQEAALNDRAVSFTKGCYVGQETVARLYYKGKPNRHLRGLRLSAPAQSGETLTFGGKEVGRVGTAVVSPTHGPIALAIVRREAAPGDTLTVGDGQATATVTDLPFS